LPNHFFGFTCVIYGSFSAIGHILKGYRIGGILTRIGLSANSVCSWLVSGYWCIGFGEWCILMLLEHMFILLSVALTLDGGALGHFLFTFIGSVVAYMARDHSRAMQSHMDGRMWGISIVATVSALTAGMCTTGWLSFEGIRRKVRAIQKILEMNDVPLEALTADSQPNSRSNSGQPSSSTDNCSSLTRSNFEVSSSFASLSVPFDELSVSRLVGQGAFGKVYMGAYNNKTVAVKVIRWDSHKAGYTKVNPLREAMIASKLCQENLVRTLTFSQIRQVDLLTGQPVAAQEDSQAQISCEVKQATASEAWIVQEWCDMGALREYCRIPRWEPPELDEAVQMFEDICNAGIYLHSHNVIHGDLTANNVLLKSSSSHKKGYVCKISDFGLARVLEGETTELLTSQLGTVSHMPPELFQMDVKRLTKKADVYAAGILLWQILLGETPFKGKSGPQIIISVVKGIRLELPSYVPPLLRDMFDHCTRTDMAERPEFSEMLPQLQKDVNFNLHQEDSSKTD
jgi:hypothetical protein